MGESDRRHQYNGCDPEPAIFFWRFLRWIGFNAYSSCDGIHSIRSTIHTNQDAIRTSICTTNRSSDNTASDSYQNSHAHSDRYLYDHSDENSNEDSDENTEEDVDENTNKNTYPDGYLRADCVTNGDP
jgi:hypothetical protein